MPITRKNYKRRVFLLLLVLHYACHSKAHNLAAIRSHQLLLALTTYFFVYNFAISLFILFIYLIYLFQCSYFYLIDFALFFLCICSLYFFILFDILMVK